LLPTVRLFAPRRANPLPSIEPIVTPGALCPSMKRKPLPPPNIETSIRAVPPSEESPKAINPPPTYAIVALPAVEVSENCVAPVSAPMFALPAVEESEKLTDPPQQILALPAVEVLLKFIPPRPFEKVALPAVEVSLKKASPPFMMAAPPAVALFENTIAPEFPETEKTVEKSGVLPELFVMPVPLRVSVVPSFAMMK